MPPRAGRKRKVGLGRIDAALDALRPMGFPDDLVRKTIRDLLKAYGGDEGWAFIEEGCYKLIIDTILPERENSKREETQQLLVGDSSMKDDTLDEPGVQYHSPDVHSMQIQTLHNHSPPPENIRKCSSKDEASQEKLSAQIQSQFVDPPPPLDTKHVKDDTLQYKLGIQTNHSQTSSVVDDSGSMINSPPPPNSSSVQRRRPFYGWISSDDDEDVELVYFKPAS
uniref:WIYLD domain-containing protein n=1 Tax=Fagus sylvatica TaxID=28930 RepID=A0A2N9HVP5_FAGSY